MGAAGCLAPQDYTSEESVPHPGKRDLFNANDAKRQMTLIF